MPRSPLTRPLPGSRIIFFAVFAFFLICVFLARLLANQQAVLKILHSRLPDRCAFCHREILDEGGVFDEDCIYHAACADKLDSLEGLRVEAGVRASEAIHKPKQRHAKGS